MLGDPLDGEPFILRLNHTIRDRILKLRRGNQSEDNIFTLNTTISLKKKMNSLIIYVNQLLPLFAMLFILYPQDLGSHH